jgi:hypothetical protein
MTAASQSDPGERGPFVVPELVEEHFDELVFLSVTRRKLRFAPDATGRQYAHHLSRMEAHWDGLVVAGGFGAELATARLQEGDGFDTAVAVAAWIGLASPDPEQVALRLVEAADEQRPGWREGLRSCAAERIATLLPVKLPSDLDADTLAVCVDAWGWHGLLDADAAAALCAHPAAGVRAGVARHLARVAGGAAWAERALDDAEPSVVRRALYSLASSDAERALAHGRRTLASEPEGFAIQLVGLLGDATDVDRIAALLEQPALRTPALCALADLGDPAAIPHLIAAFDDPDPSVAERARASVDRIVGEMPDFETRTDETDDDESAADLAARAWSEIETRFPVGERFLRGAPFPPPALGDENTMEARWLATWIASRMGGGPLPREVPDGFWNGEPTEEALAGE